jgi:hypothetical protein
MQEMLDRGYAMSHDRHNGTQKSYYQLLNAHANMMDGRKPDEIVRAVLQPLYDKMVNYFETKKYIFVHSWIPVNADNKHNPILTYREDWRNATDEEFELATWGNPFEMAKQGLNQTGKVLIFGHFHTSYQWSKDGKCSEFGDDAIFDPYFGKDFIALDACTVHTNKVNVITLEDELIND